MFSEQLGPYLCPGFGRVVRWCDPGIGNIAPPEEALSREQRQERMATRRGRKPWLPRPEWGNPKRRARGS